MAGQGRVRPGGRRRRRAWVRSALLVLAGIATVLVPMQFEGTAGAEGGLPGTLDPTFGNGGIALNELVSNLSGVSDSARLPDGRVLVLAADRVWRFFADGTLDTTFDHDGVLVPPSADTMRPTHLALRPGGGFVLAGSSFSTDCPAGRVAEFDANGGVVTGFGTDGVACVDFPNFRGAADIAVQADGRILVLGSNQAAGGASHLALARLDDTNGATVNQIIQPLQSQSSFESGDALAIQPGGNVVVVGDTNTFPNFLRIGVVLTRYLGNSLALDTSFGGGHGAAVESISLDRSRAPLRFALQPDGQGMSVVVAGENVPSSGTEVAAFEQVLFDPNGTLSSNIPTVTELTGHSFAVLDDLTATATGYVAIGHVEDSNPLPARDTLVTVPLGQDFTEPDPVFISHPRANLSLAGATSQLLPDGKVLVASVLAGPSGEQMLFNRLIPDTSADPPTVTVDPTIGTAFGQPGFLTRNALTADRGEAVVVQPDDSKVLVGGETSTAQAGPAGSFGGHGFVLRHNDDGSLDTNFGGPERPPARPGVSFVDFEVNGVALAAGGKVVAAGSRFFPGDGESEQDGAVQRLRPDGSPDTLWNEGQPAFAAVRLGGSILDTFFHDVAVQPDGAVVVVGDAHQCGCAGSKNWIVVGRFRPDGTLDDSFGTNGFTLIGPVAGADRALAQGRGVVLQSDGKIVVTGNLGSNLVVARLSGGGNPDLGFAVPPGPFGAGVLVDDLIPGATTDRGFGRDVALRPDGRIVVAGALVTVNCSSEVACFTTNEAIVTQYLPAGKRDPSFGTGGLALVAGPGSQGSGVAVDATGNVLVGGTATSSGTGADLLLARLLANGTPDPAFGTGGTTLTDVNQATDVANGLALAPDGKIVLAGANTDSRGDRVLTARYDVGGTLQCTPPSLPLGPVVLGDAPATGSTTCTNTGPSRLTITDVAVSGTNPGDFGRSGECVPGLPKTLAPGESCSILVTFTPGAVGSRSAVVVITHTQQGKKGPTTVGVTGTGIARSTTLTFAPTPLAFPARLGLSTSPPQPVTVTNTGTAQVIVNGVSVVNGSPGEFTISTTSCRGASGTLQPGGRCQVSVTFTPRAPGARSAVLRFDDNGAGAPHDLVLRGTGETPTLLVNPGVGRAGAVTAATGTQFPPNRAVTLAWVDPVTLLPGSFSEPAFTMTSGPDGSLTGPVLVFPKSRTGGRALLATFGPFTANASFLVTPGTVQPPDFVYRR